MFHFTLTQITLNNQVVRKRFAPFLDAFSYCERASPLAMYMTRTKAIMLYKRPQQRFSKAHISGAGRPIARSSLLNVTWM